MRKQATMIATDGHAIVPRDDAGSQVRLLGRIDLWRREQPDHPTRMEAIRRLVTSALRAEAERAAGREVATPNAVASEAAGQAAFETYGSWGAPINPHNPGSLDRASWTKGFGMAADGHPSAVA
jgi:hypothetical protein